MIALVTEFYLKWLTTVSTSEIGFKTWSRSNEKEEKSYNKEQNPDFSDDSGVLEP